MDNQENSQRFARLSTTWNCLSGTTGCGYNSSLFTYLLYLTCAGITAASF